MSTKLTLVIDPGVIETAKEYARKQHTSVSKLVERYLGLVGGSEAQRTLKPAKLGPLTSALAGAVKPLVPEDVEKSAKELIREAKMERFR